MWAQEEETKREKERESTQPLPTVFVWTDYLIVYYLNRVSIKTYWSSTACTY